MDATPAYRQPSFATGFLGHIQPIGCPHSTYAMKDVQDEGVKIG